MEVQLRETVSGLGEGLEVAGERNARQLLLEVVREALAVLRRVQHAVDVIEDLLLGDAARDVGVSITEDPERSVGDGVVANPAGGLVRCGISERRLLIVEE